MNTERLTLPERPPESDSETYAAFVVLGGAIARASRGQVTELYRGGEMIARIAPPVPRSAARSAENCAWVRSALARRDKTFAIMLEQAVVHLQLQQARRSG